MSTEHHSYNHFQDKNPKPLVPFDYYKQQKIKSK